MRNLIWKASEILCHLTRSRNLILSAQVVGRPVMEAALQCFDRGMHSKIIFICFTDQCLFPGQEGLGVFTVFL